MSSYFILQITVVFRITIWTMEGACVKTIQINVEEKEVGRETEKEVQRRVE